MHATTMKRLPKLVVVADRGRIVAYVPDENNKALRVVKEAEGEAQRFNSVNDEYSKAPEVTRKRLFLETMEQVLKNSKKVIIDEKQGVVPYLPLNEIGKPSQQGG